MKQADVRAARRFLVASGTATAGDQIVDVILGQLGDAADLPAEFVEELRRKVDAGELVDRIAAAYAERISSEDLERLSDFFESGVGRRYVEQLPALTQESVRLGQEWGESVGPRILKEVEARLDAAIEELEERATARKPGADLG